MKVCKRCKRIIINDFEEWLRKNPDAVYIQCPYFDCMELEKIK